MKTSFIIFLFLSWFCLHSHAQIEIINDRFDYENATFDITIRNVGDDPLFIEEVGLKFNWIFVLPPTILTSGGSKQTIKPLAKYTINVPSHGSGIKTQVLENRIVCANQELVRLQVGLNTTTSSLNKAIYYALELRPTLIFEGQDTLFLWNRLLEEEDFDVLKGDAKPSNLLRLNLMNKKDELSTFSKPQNEPSQEKRQAKVPESQVILNGVFNKNQGINTRIENINWLYKSSIPTESLAGIYQELLSETDDGIRSAAIKGIYRLGLSEFTETITEILTNTDSFREASESLKALISFNLPYEAILKQRLKQPGLSSELVGLFALELGKIQSKIDIETFFTYLGREDLKRKDYDKVKTAFQLLKTKTHNPQLAQLIQEKSAWAYATDKVKNHHFSKLLELAMFASEPEVFVPIIEEILGEQPVDEEIMKHLFQLGFIMYNLYKTEEERWKKQLFLVGFDNDYYRGDWYNIIPSEQKTLELYLRYDSRFYRKPIYYAEPDSNWLRQLKSVYPKYMAHQNANIRYQALFYADLFNEDKSLLNPLLDVAIQDSIVKVRKFAADLIIRYDKQIYKPQIARNISKTIDYYEINQYCHFIGEECSKILRTSLKNYLNVDPNHLKAVLNYLVNMDSVRARELLMLYPAILKNHPDENARLYALQLILAAGDQNPKKLKEQLAIAFKDSSSSVTNYAERKLAEQLIHGFEKLAANRLKNPDYQYSIKYYTQYLGNQSIPIIKETLLDPALEYTFAYHHIENIKRSFLAKEWPHFSEGLIYWFQISPGKELRAITFGMLNQFKDSSEMKPIIKMALEDPESRIRMIGARSIHDYPRSTFKEVIMANLQDTLSSEAEIDAYIQYLQSDATPILAKIWKDPSVSDKVKGRYFKGMANHWQHLDVSYFEGAFAYFYDHGTASYQIFALNNLFFQVADTTQQKQYLSEALGSSNTHLREVAAETSWQHRIAGLEELISNNLSNYESSRTEKKHYLTYLKNEAIPLLKDIFRSTRNKETIYSYFVAIAENYPDFRLYPFVDVFQQHKYPEEYKFKNIALTLLYLACLQENMNEEANALLLNHHGIPKLISDIGSEKHISERAFFTNLSLQAQELINERTPGKKVFSEYDLAREYGNTAWYFLFAREFAKAEQAAKHGLELDSSQTWIYSNYALGLLFQGKYEAAKEMYLDYKGQNNNSGRSFRDVFLKDFDDLETAGITHPDVAKIKNLLKKE